MQRVGAEDHAKLYQALQDVQENTRTIMDGFGINTLNDTTKRTIKKGKGNGDTRESAHLAAANGQPAPAGTESGQDDAALTAFHHEWNRCGHARFAAFHEAHKPLTAVCYAYDSSNGNCRWGDKCKSRKFCESPMG